MDRITRTERKGMSIPLQGFKSYIRDAEVVAKGSDADPWRTAERRPAREVFEIDHRSRRRLRSQRRK
jgi:hypothetical protein